MSDIDYKLDGIDICINSDACLIDEGDTFLVTGGPDLTNLKRVSRYSQSSWVEDLGDLNSGRYNHACGWFTDTGGRRVRENITVKESSKLLS